MGISERTIKGCNGYDICLYVYETDAETVRGSVLALHGMAEHHERYDGFFTALNKAGYDVYTYDHRGHGKRIPEADLGFFAEKDGDELVIEDAVAAMKYVYENKRSAGCALFGHSMGSMIARIVLQRFDKMDCALITGTACMGDGKVKSGIFLANLISKVRGARHRSPLLNKAMFETKEYLRDRTRTPFDWLTTDEAVVDRYIADDRCGFLCTASFYRDLVSITGKSTWGMAATRKDLPIFLASGKDDPVGDFGVGVETLYKKYQDLGYTNVTMKLYEGCRHELLNEKSKDEVIKEFIEFFDKYMK